MRHDPTDPPRPCNSGTAEAHAPQEAAPPSSRVAPSLASIGAWQYADRGRDLRLDFLRGFAVFAMIADHLEQPGGPPSWLSWITLGDRFLFSMAEVFVLISGLVMGIVYRRVLVTQGMGAVVRKAFRRAARLYALTIMLGFSFAAVSYRLDLSWVDGDPAGAPIAWAAETLSLHRVVPFVDVLALYTLLVAAAPLAFLLIAKRRTPFLLLGSWSLWALYQRWPGRMEIPWKIEDNSVFHFAPWQVLFFTGIVIGYHRERIGAWARRVPARWPGTALGGLAIAACAAWRYSAPLLAHLAPGSNPSGWGHRYFGKADLRIGRLLALAVFFLCAYLVLTVCWEPLVRAFGTLLLPLGQHALLAYGLHLGVFILIAEYIPRVPGFDEQAPLLNLLIQIIGVLLVWLGVNFRSVAWQLGAEVARRAGSHHIKKVS